MSDKLRCNCPYPDCGKMMEYSAWRAGRQFPCPACKREFIFPAAPVPDPLAEPAVAPPKAVDWAPVQPPPPQTWQPPAVQPPPVYQPPAPPPQMTWPAPPVPQPPAPAWPPAPPVPAPPWPSGDRPRPRRDTRIEIDREPERREQIRRYFRGEQPAALIPAIIFFAVMTVLGVVLLFTVPFCGFILCGVAVLVGAPALLRAILKPAIATEEEVRQCIREDRRAIERAADRRVAEFLASVPSDRLPGWEAPQKFAGPCLVQDSEDERAGVRGDEQFRVTGRKTLHVAGSNVMLVVLGTYQLVTYRIGVNHLTGQAFEDQLQEFFYQDVVTAQSVTQSRRFALGPDAAVAENPSLAWWLGLPIIGPILAYLFRHARSEVVWESFAIHSSGGTHSTVDLNFEYVGNATDHQGAIDREDMPEELAVRNRLREVKALARREV